MRDEAFWDRAVTWAFLAVLAVWMARSWRMLPYDFSDLCYLLSLDSGTAVTQEWVHPLFVPFLAAFRWVLGLFGYTGRMLVPLEVLGIGLSGLTLAGLYFFAAYWSRDKLLSSLAVLVLAFSNGFWQGALRPTPYALTALFFAAALMLLAGPLPRAAKPRHLLAGCAAGVAAGFHAAALSLLVPAAAAAALEKPASWQVRLGLFGRFLAGFAAALAAAYGVFLARYASGPGFFKMSFSDLFYGVEQMPGSSIYTSGSWRVQAADLAWTLSLQGRPFIWLALVFGAACVAAWACRLFKKDEGPSLPPPSASRALMTAAAGSCGLALFFLINNRGNGFVYGSLLPLTLLLAHAGSRAKVLRRLFVAGSAVALALVPFMDAHWGQSSQDPMLVEARFLDAALGPGDILALPGRPAPELFYFKHFNALEVACLSAAAPDSQVRRVEADELERRASAALARGRRVLLARGNKLRRFTVSETGEQKAHQIYWTDETDARIRERRLFSLEGKLKRTLLLDQVLVSPQGWEYLLLERGSAPGHAKDAPRPANALPGGGRGARSPTSTAPRPATGADPDLGPLRHELVALRADAWVLRRFDYLARWIAEAPDDLHACADLVDLMARFLSERHGKPDPGLRERLRRDFLASLGRADAPGAAGLWQEPVSRRLNDQGVALFMAKQPGAARVKLAEALDSDPYNFSALVSLCGLLSSAGKPREALDYCDRAVALSRSFDAAAASLAHSNREEALRAMAAEQRGREKAR
ncbi:MAG: hypothetical protein HZB91_11955 [Elusimicrobia bacterium]|nr:hypothetical protein [Elusimicrobiota bacterium]